MHRGGKVVTSWWVQVFRVWCRAPRVQNDFQGAVCCVSTTSWLCSVGRPRARPRLQIGCHVLLKRTSGAYSTIFPPRGEQRRAGEDRDVSRVRARACARACVRVLLCGREVMGEVMRSRGRPCGHAVMRSRGREKHTAEHAGRRHAHVAVRAFRLHRGPDEAEVCPAARGGWHRQGAHGASRRACTKPFGLAAGGTFRPRWRPRVIKSTAEREHHGHGLKTSPNEEFFLLLGVPGIIPGRYPGFPVG